MKARRYETPAAFKTALDQRLRNVAEPGVGIVRRRQLLVFDRYLARLVRVLGRAATLKGGLALELRLERARTTRDIDLRLVGSSSGSVVSCVPGRLACFELEGPGDRCILQR